MLENTISNLVSNITPTPLMSGLNFMLSIPLQLIGGAAGVRIQNQISGAFQCEARC